MMFIIVLILTILGIKGENLLNESIVFNLEVKGLYYFVPVKLEVGDVNLLLDTSTAPLTTFPHVTQLINPSSDEEHIFESKLSTDEIERKFERISIETETHYFNSRNISIPVWASKKYYESLHLTINGNSIMLSDIINGNPPAKPFPFMESFSWNKIDGLYGVSYETIRLQHSVFPRRRHYNSKDTAFTELFSLVSHKVFSITFDSVSPKLIVGGFPEVYDKAITLPDLYTFDWSEREASDLVLQYSFPIFHMNICNENVFTTFGVSHLFVEVDSTAACLSLPNAVFTMAMTWLPAECSDDEFLEHFLTTSDYNRYGFCRKALAEKVSPTISFRLSEQGKEFHISLVDLLLANGDDEERICIITNDSNKIFFGTLVLKQFTFLFDREEDRVGLIQRKSKDVTPNIEGCAIPVSCPDDTTYNEVRNDCIQNICTLFDFKNAHQPLHSCYAAIGLTLFILTPLMFCSCFDIFAVIIQSGLPKRLLKEE